MGLVLLDMAMSLDGFAADRNGGAGDLYPDFEEFRKSDVLQELIRTTGAVVMGRHAYDMGDPDGFEDYEYQVPIFVLTHRVPERPAPGLSFTFVTDGVESAVEQARAAAGEKNVMVIGGADTAQQCLRAGLLDEVQIRLVPVLLGEGVRLFDDLGAEHISLERVRLVESPGVTHLRFRVV